MKTSKFLWLGAAATFQLLTAGTAIAQTPVAGAEANDFDEIIVTARKTAEKLLNAPISVAVVTSQSIDRLGLDSIQDLSRTTAGLVFDDSLGRDANRPVIRGQANILGQSGVAFFIDGIYYSGSLADYDVDTIARVEVVKGPQSALYGRNTYSGAINIISKAPAEKWEGRVQADFSENGRYDITAGVRGPIAPGLGIALGGRYFDNAGDFTNAYDNSKIGRQSTRSAYGMINYNNGGIVRASLRGNYNRTDDGQPAIFSTNPDANNCLTDNGSLYRGKGRYFCGVIQPQPISSDYSRQFVDSKLVGLESDTFNAGFRFDVDFSDSLTLTSLSGYNRRTATTQTDGDYSGSSFQTAIFAAFPVGPAPAPVTPPRTLRYAVAASTQDFSFSNYSKTTDFSQELRLQYSGDRLKLMVGGYYFKQKDDTQDTRIVPANALSRAQASANAAVAATCLRLPLCGAINPFTASTPNSRNTNNFKVRNIAIFGSINFDITDKLSLSAEGRYAEEKIDQSTQNFNEGTPAPTPILATATFKRFTPRITLDWQATPDNLFYGVYAEGQKPGGFNGSQAIQRGLASYDAEDVRSFELGMKNRFLDGTFSANFAIFHNEISGYQLTQNVFVPPNTTSAVVNAGNARVNGFEAELVFRPIRALTVTANYALANARFTSGVDEQQGVLNDVADDQLVNCSTGDQFPTVAGCQSKFGSIKGKAIPRAPEHSVFVDIDYRTEIGSSGWTVFGGGNIYLLSSNFAQVHNLAETGSSVVSDLRAGFQNDMFRVQFYVRNLFDESAVSQIIRYADANNDLRRNFIAGQRPGRRFGVIAAVNF